MAWASTGPRRARRGGVTVFALVAAVLVAPARAAACDVCAVYTATEMRESRTGFRVGAAEQLTRFTTLQEDGEEIPNPAGERLTSSTTQVLLGYQLTPRFGLQLNLPLVSRTFRRLQEGRIVHGDETGVGDLSLLALGRPFGYVTERSVFELSLLGGLKLPSGDSSRLAEELAEGHHHGAAAALAGHAPEPLHAAPSDASSPGGGDEPQSGIHGHDLALGSGSVDGIVGGSLFWSWQQLFVTAAGQYAIRTVGDFDYCYANDLVWQIGPGVYPLLGHRGTLGVQALFSGETKGKDRLDGVRLDDTGITALYLGPALSFTWGTSLGADVAADLPVRQANTALQIVADFRIRGGFTWRF